jgi:hypothetical protein
LAKWFLAYEEILNSLEDQRIVLNFVEREVSHDAELMLIAGGIYEQDGLFEDAERIFRLVLSNDPDNEEAGFRLTHNLILQKNDNERPPRAIGRGADLRMCCLESG